MTVKSVKMIAGEKKEMIIINWVHWDDGILSGKMQYSDDRLCRAIKFS